MPEPIVAIDGAPTPEEEALIADGVGLALYIVLETLAPAERLAFVLHDMFAMPFDEIAPIVGRSPEAARQLASRARRRVQGAKPEPDVELAEQKRVVDAFLAAAREGDFDALLEMLDPEVTLRVDAGPDSPLAREPIVGAEEVLAEARRWSALAPLQPPGDRQRRRRRGHRASRRDGVSRSSRSRSRTAASTRSTSWSTLRSSSAFDRRSVSPAHGRAYVPILGSPPHEVTNETMRSR